MDTGQRQSLISRYRGNRNGPGKKKGKKKTWFEVHIPDKDGNKDPQKDVKGYWFGVRVKASSKAQGRSIYLRALTK